jgi:hydrogenase maturation protein HypF
MFYVTPCDFRRVAQLRYIPLVGGEKAVWEVWRLAAAWLDATYGRRFLRLSIPFVKRLDKKKWHIMEGMMNKRVNCPLSSSMGRLFDAVAVLSGAAPFVISQEAEAAMALERQARAFRGKKSAYPFSLKKERDGSLLIDPRPLLRKIIEDIRRGASPEGIAANFHVSIAHMVARVVSELRKMYDFQTVIFSGGVFQNQLLKELLGREFSSLKCRLYWPLTIPAHDGGISVGQAFLAQETTRKV